MDSEDNSSEAARLLEDEWLVLNDTTYAKFQALCNGYSKHGVLTEERQRALANIMRLLESNDYIAGRLFARGHGSTTLLIQVAASASATDELRSKVVRLLLLQQKQTNATPELYLLQLEGLGILPSFTNALMLTIETGLSTKNGARISQGFR